MTIYPSSNNPDNDQEDNSLNILLSSPEIRQAIAQIPELIKDYSQTKITLAEKQIDAQVNIAKGLSTRTLIATGLVTLMVIGAIVLLAHWDKLSSDAVSIVLGTIIGGSFTFLGRAFYRGRD